MNNEQGILNVEVNSQSQAVRTSEFIIPCSIFIILILGLTSCGGNNNNSTSNIQNTATPNSAGKTVYQKTCILCHEPDGKGMNGAFPPLAGSDYFLADKFRAIRQVIKGSTGQITVNGTTYQGVMPPQALNDSDIAQVLTYISHSFGNNGFDVTIADVKSVRDTLK